MEGRDTFGTDATSPGHCWGEQFTYDAWTNLSGISGSGSAYTGCTQESLSLSINGNNQITNTGFAYDATGNTTGDGAYTYAYDGDNQLTSAGGVTYTYDGEGRRVQKSNGKLYWYGTGSTPLDESDASGNITDEFVFFAGARIARRNISSGNIYYYFADHLGTARVVTNASGSVLDDSDFYPFGGERVVSSSSGNTYKFEGKERDTESGNDDFGARFYASRYGRFLSVDWSAVPAPVPYANLANPQTLNLFSFVADNPETFADLDGHSGQGGEPVFEKLSQIGDALMACESTNGQAGCPQLEALFQNETTNSTADVREERKNEANQAAQPQNQPEIVTGTGYNGQSAVELRTSQTTMTVDAHGNQITQEVHTRVFFSNETGHEGQFLGATQTTFTTKTSPTGKETETVGNASITRDVAQAAVGNKAFVQGMQVAANPNRQVYLNRAIINDAKAHPGRYVAAAGGIASLVLGPAGYPVAAGVARVIGLAGALYDRLTN